MKFFKKVISCLMAGIVAITAAVCMTVGAGAEENRYNVTGLYNAEGSFCVSAHNIFEGFFIIDNFEPKPAFISLCILFENSGLRLMATSANPEVGFECSLLDGDKKIDISGEHLCSGQAGFGGGFVFYLDGNSKYIDAITKEETVTVGTQLYIPTEEGFAAYTITPDAGIEADILGYYAENVYWNTEKPGFKDISSLNFSKISNKNYTGKARKPEVTVKDGDKTLKEGTDYTLSYKNNTKIGTATVTVTGKGEYTGTKTLTFKIVPPKTTLKASKSGEKVKLSWGAAKGAEKYQIYYSENGGKFKKLATVSGSKTSYSTSKLDFKKNTYQFKIRSYAKSGGKTYYSAYSKAVSLK